MYPFSLVNLPAISRDPFNVVGDIFDANQKRGEVAVQVLYAVVVDFAV